MRQILNSSGVIGFIEFVCLIAPGCPVMSGPARKKLKIRSRYIGFDPVINLIRLAGMLAHGGNDQLTHGSAYALWTSLAGKQAELRVFTRGVSKADVKILLGDKKHVSARAQGLNPRECNARIFEAH